jgi:NADPH2:quinone reductase
VKAAVLSGVGGSFTIEDVPDPEVGDGQELVRVRAAALNFADVLIRRGRYPQLPEFPAIIGAELAGELEDGTRVMALAGHGGYAELAAVRKSALVPLPEHAPWAEGAAFLLTFLTAYIPLTRQVVLRDDSTVLVYAAAGGVGTATIQVARALGANVIAAAGSAEKLALCRDLGAAEAYLYDEIPEDLRVDVVVDPIGGDLFDPAIARLKPLGQLVAIGFAAGMWPEVQPANLVGRNVGIQGVYLGRLMRHAPEVVAAAVGELLELWNAAKIRPLVGAEFPLVDVEKAHELLESRGSVGKIVLRP